MSPDSTTAKEVFIQGITLDGKTFRPSDWAERLAGVMSQFRPHNVRCVDGHISYSPWCIPTRINNIKCVVLNTQLQQHYPKAWDYVLGFAKDNNLLVVDGCFIDAKHN